MSTLSSASTITEVEAAYLDNGSYAEDSSASKAAAFITACRLLILWYRKNVEHLGGTKVETEVALYERQIAEAQRWLATNPAGAAGGGVRHADFRSFRD